MPGVNDIAVEKKTDLNLYQKGKVWFLKFIKEATVRK